MTGLEYVSSAGLRVILKAQKIMNTQGSMKLVGVNDSIMEVFDINKKKVICYYFYYI